MDLQLASGVGRRYAVGSGIRPDDLGEERYSLDQQGGR